MPGARTRPARRLSWLPGGPAEGEGGEAAPAPGGPESRGGQRGLRRTGARHRAALGAIGTGVSGAGTGRAPPRPPAAAAPGRLPPAREDGGGLSLPALLCARPRPSARASQPVPVPVPVPVPPRPGCREGQPQPDCYFRRKGTALLPVLTAALSALRRRGVSSRGAARALWSLPLPGSSAAAAAAGSSGGGGGGGLGPGPAPAPGLPRACPCPGPALPAAAMELEAPEEAEGSAVAGAGAITPEAGVGGLDAAGGNALRAPGHRHLRLGSPACFLACRRPPRGRSRPGPPECVSPGLVPRRARGGLAQLRLRGGPRGTCQPGPPQRAVDPGGAQSGSVQPPRGHRVVPSNGCPPCAPAPSQGPRTVPPPRGCPLDRGSPDTGKGARAAAAPCLPSEEVPGRCSLGTGSCERWS